MRGVLTSRSLPLLSLTLSMDIGVTLLPPLARGQNAVTISISDREEEPSPSVRSEVKGEVMPMARAYFFTVPVPILLNSFTVTIFFEYVRPFNRIIGPPNFPEKFSGFQSVPSTFLYTMGESMIRSETRSEERRVGKECRSR